MSLSKLVSTAKLLQGHFLRNQLFRTALDLLASPSAQGFQFYRQVSWSSPPAALLEYGSESIWRQGHYQSFGAAGREITESRSAVLSCLPMTKVQTSYGLSRTLGDQDLNNLSRLPSVYGIFFAKVAPKLDRLLIEYDASRMTPTELQAVLETHGLPIVVPTT